MPNYRTITITGPPVSLKNGKEKTRWGLRSSDKVLDAKARAGWQVKKQWGGKPPITGPVSLKIISYGKWMRGQGNVIDASNLYLFPEDILEAARVIDNDNQVEHHDGSRRIYLCDSCDKKKWRSKKKEWAKCGAVKQCDKEKVVITIKIL